MIDIEGDRPVNGSGSVDRAKAQSSSLKVHERKEPDTDAPDSCSQAKRFQNNQSIYTRSRINMDEALWDIMGELAGESRMTGIIPQLEPHFTSFKRKSNTASAYLCSPYTDYVTSGFVDIGWDCGYRNCQMLMTFLQRQQEAGDYILKHVGDVSGLQQILEKAWEEGFDPEGAKQLKHHVYKTRKWIGTTEVYSMLVYLGVRCTILDFHHATGPKNRHDTLFDWIQSYFESATVTKPDGCAKDVVHITDRPPLYLQYSGHSITVIGIEVLKDKRRNLIVFDPQQRMLRSYRSKPLETTGDESDITSSVEDEDEYDSSQNSSPSSSSSTKRNGNGSETSNSNGGLATRLLAGWRDKSPFTRYFQRPFRVDEKAIARNKQYQLLILGEVVDQRAQGGNLCWNKDKGYLLNEEERELMKTVTSMGAS
ncbi:hypothetical protein EC973_001123 [Apophysomyces ossiformis]|uniref:UFSP1/2/DUB catalytic domain-containing protein n=1 Tax=Apophysomyces ossiformis TaxID=679940 RepID=A0A8H7BPR3_9FUNG|nr:hypothetical protein EC973_001123 [Apophysomyces ossiformis]